MSKGVSHRHSGSPTSIGSTTSTIFETSDYDTICEDCSGRDFTVSNIVDSKTIDPIEQLSAVAQRLATLQQQQKQPRENEETKAVRFVPTWRV